MIDTAAWTVPLFLFTWIVYIFVFIAQKNKLESSTARLQILSLRTAFCLPFYGT